MVDTRFAEADPLGSTRFYAVLLWLFAALGLLTASVGLYGLVSYSVGRRTHEIGVRIALGASLWRVRWLTIADVLTSVGAGIVAGLVATLWLSGLVASQLFRVAPQDPIVLALTVLCLVTVSGIAVVAPVRRATRIDPAEALRAD